MSSTRLDEASSVTGPSRSAAADVEPPGLVRSGDDDRTRTVLKARAQRLAQRPAEPGAADTVEVLEFSAHGARWAVEARWVRGVHPLRGLAPLPCVPAAVLGLINVRGRIVPVLSLASLPGLQGADTLQAAPSPPATPSASIVLLQSGDVELAVAADDAGAVRTLAPALLQPRPGSSGGESAPLVRGVTADGRALLDVPALLADPRLLVDEIPDSGTREETS